jgi:hypothetical protein
MALFIGGGAIELTIVRNDPDSGGRNGLDKSIIV